MSLASDSTVASFSAGVASKVLDLLLHPKNTVQMVLRRMRLDRALRGGAVAKDKRRGLKTHATVCR